MAKSTLTITDNRTGKSQDIPITNGAIRAMDLRQLKSGSDDFGLLTYDPAFMNTASTRSAITFIDGDKGILWYRGYPIEQLAEQATFMEVAYLLLRGELPTQQALDEWQTAAPRLVAPQLPDDRRDGVRAEVVTALDVEPVDGLDQADRARLHEVVGLLGRAREAAGERTDERQVPLDRLVPRGAVVGIVVPREQLERVERRCQSSSTPTCTSHSTPRSKPCEEKWGKYMNENNR